MQIFCVYFVIASNGLKCIMIITSIMIMWTPMYVYLHKQFLLESLDAVQYLYNIPAMSSYLVTQERGLLTQVAAQGG